MDIIRQQLTLKDWPLNKIGDEAFFGYIVAVGVFPGDWEDENGMIPFVDFSYNDQYIRYRLPDNAPLMKQLFDFVRINIETYNETANCYGKVWIKLTKNGYKVDLP